MHSRKRPMAKGIPYFRLGLATMNYASADLKAVVDEASAIPWREAFKSGKERTVQTRDFITAIRKKKSSLPPWYEQAKKQIGKQEELTIVDGKEHKKVSDSKMGAGEKEAFKDLLNVINRGNTWYWKIVFRAAREIALIFPIPL
jgi:ATP-dependent 26S proteasome regulatory subunit